MKKTIAVLLALTLVLAIFSGCGQKNSEDKIRIGTISPNTGSLSAFGQAANNGIKLAVKEINAAGGILGKEIELLVYDDKADPTEAANSFNKLADEEVSAVIGAITSGVTSGLVPLANEAEIVLLTPSATADTVTQENDFVFRACYKDSDQGALVAKYVADDLKAKKVAVLYASSDPYSSGLYTSFKAEAAVLGLNIVAEESSSSVADTDYSSQLTKIVSSGAEVIFAPYYYDVIGPYIVPQARAAGFSGYIMGADGFDGTIGTMVEDKTLYNKVVFTNHYSSDDPAEKVQNFVKVFTEEYGADTLNGFAALGYDSVYMLKQAMESANSIESKAIRDALEGMSFSGVTGSFTFDESGTPQKSVSIIEFVDGAAKLVGIVSR